MLELLLNYWTLAGAGLLFFGSLLALCLCRKRLSAGVKGLLWAVHPQFCRYIFYAKYSKLQFTGIFYFFTLYHKSNLLYIPITTLQ